MPYTLHIFLTLFSLLFCALSSRADSSSELLKELDKIVANRNSYEKDKRKRIDEAWRDHGSASTDSDRYNTLRTLYKEYRTFRIDSAISIANERLEIARRMKNRSKATSATLNLAESYLKTGLADKAISIMDTLNKESLEDYHLKYLNSVYKNAYLLLSKTEMLPSEKIKAMERVRHFRELALADSPDTTKTNYTIRAEKYLDVGMFAEAVAKIEEADRRFDFANDAPMQFMMGKIYLAAGMRKKAIEALSRAAALDLSTGTKEYQALILLASILFEEGDVERAFVYINCALDDIHFSNANIRNPEIMESMPVIDKAFHAYQQKNRQLSHTFLWIAGGLLLLLLVFLFVLLKLLRTNRRMLADKKEINQCLRHRNAELEEADKIKLKSINALIMSNARYISRLKDYRKTVYRFMKAGQYDKAIDALKSNHNDSKDIEAFHEMFDELFLSIFPDFLERVNNLLKEPIELKDANRLTPELRIIALLRLGLSSTDEIANILHYTPQSVYNLRSTIRAKSRFSRDEFEEAIKSL